MFIKDNCGFLALNEIRKYTRKPKKVRSWLKKKSARLKNASSAEAR